MDNLNRNHPLIRHRDEFLALDNFSFLRTWNVKIANWTSVRFLGSLFMFDVALTVPLLALLPGMQPLYRVLLILSGNWIQLFALFVLQRSQIVIQAKEDAQADANQETLTHIAHVLDQQTVLLQHLTRGKR